MLGYHLPWAQIIYNNVRTDNVNEFSPDSVPNFDNKCHLYGTILGLLGLLIRFGSRLYMGRLFTWAAELIVN